MYVTITKNYTYQKKEKKKNYNMCRDTDYSPHLAGNRGWAQQAQYNKFVREWVEEFGWQRFSPTVIGGWTPGREG